MEKVEIQARAQSADEEFEYLMGVLSRMDFYKKHGYMVSLPEHPVFLSLAEKSEFLKSENPEKLKEIFKNEIYDESFYENAISAINKRMDILESVLARIASWQNYGFKLFSKYDVKLTAYGPGGSYDSKQGSIIMKCNKSGNFNKAPQHIIAHEIVHIAVEESIVQSFNLTNNEKEALVDAVCAYHLGDILRGYKVQPLGDKNILKIVAEGEISGIGEVIGRYKTSE